MALSEANSHCEYTVSWLDSTARGHDAMRGIFMCGDHDGNTEPRNVSSGAKYTVPIDLPTFALNRTTVSAFNSLFFTSNSGSGLQQLSITNHSFTRSTQYCTGTECTEKTACCNFSV